MEKNRIRALVVEDDPALRKLVQGYLTGMEFEVLEAGDGQGALNWLKNESLDLVCLDLMLPEASGYDLCDFIRQHQTLKNVPVLMMSARSLPEDRAQAEEAGANGYLVKPFSRRAFTQQVLEVMARGRRSQEEA